MALINENFLKLKAGYLFPEISRRVNSFKEQNPEANIIKLGIGDVTRPLPPSIIKQMHEACDEMASETTFKGYGPEQGYSFLRDAIALNDYQRRGIDIQSDEIFISDGSKCDTGNIQEIFSKEALVAVTDPVYPVYVDTNVMAGRTGSMNEKGQYDGFEYLPTNKDNEFCPPLPSRSPDLMYICSPNNPTGTVLTKDQLKKFVDYAIQNKTIILYDAAYEAFITDSSLPKSIYEIDGASSCAIEFRSFSKNAGFTGTRCAFTVVPKNLKGFTKNEEPVDIHKLWNRRHCTKFNGVSYIIQKGALAVYSEQGRKEVQELISYYLENASIIGKTLKSLDFNIFGGINAPYIWFETKDKMSSWDFFDKLLKETHIVGTPGSGFGASGEGYFRLSAFGDRENIKTACQRITDKL